MIKVFSNESFWAFLAINALLAWGLFPMAMTGQLSLGQAGFMAVGAYASSWANVELEFPLATAMSVGTLAAALVAIPVAVGAVRVRGTSLIVGTLAAGEVIRIGISTLDPVGGVEGYFGMTPVGLPPILLLVAVIGAGLLVLDRTTLGLAMRAVRADEDAAESLAIPARRVKVGAVVVGAAITGLAGALSAHYVTFVRPDHFGVTMSFEIALFVLIGGIGHPAGPLLGAFALTYLPEAFRPLAEYRVATFGVAILVLMIVSPSGLVTRRRIRRLQALLRRHRWLPRARRRRTTQRRLGRPVGAAVRPGLTGLRVHGLTKRYAGVVALDGVSLDVRSGEIVGLIGPNGAGKTTLIDIAGGRIAADHGTVALAGDDVSRLSPHRRGGLGLARTFQATRLFPTLTIGEHVRLAARWGAGREEVRAVTERLDLGEHEGRFPGELPLGVRRRVQLAQCLVGRPVALMLDEPSIGLHPDELREVTDAIGEARATGAAVLLVDHNVDLVMELADRVVVLDFGRTIAEGTPGEIVADPLVQAAYLGGAAGQEGQAQ